MIPTVAATIRTVSDDRQPSPPNQFIQQSC